MKMIAHQAIRMHLPMALPARFLQRLQKQPTILISQKNVLPPIPSIHYVVNRPLVFNPQTSRHPVTIATPIKCVNMNDRPLNPKLTSPNHDASKITLCLPAARHVLDRRAPNGHRNSRSLDWNLVRTEPLPALHSHHNQPRNRRHSNGTNRRL